MLRVIPLVAVLVAGCTHGTTASVCEIVAQPEKYNGSLVTVNGTFRQGRHGALLVDSNCPDTVIVVGEAKRTNRSFQDVVWANYLPSGRYITASLKGKYVYTPAAHPGRLLDNYTVIQFQIGQPKSPP